MVLTYRQFVVPEMRKLRKKFPNMKQTLIMKKAAVEWQAYKKKHGIAVKAAAKRRKSPRRKSPRRKSPRRKSPKRKSPKRKSKRKSPKRKSPKRKSKRKSPKRKSPKRKSPRRKSPKRRSGARRCRQYGYGYQGTDMAALKSVLLQRLYGNN